MRWRLNRSVSSSGDICMVSVRMVTATSAAPFSGVDWLMVTMLAPAALRPARRRVDLSRSAFYKYKDCIFDSENGREVVTVMATLRDETGALQSLLAGISAAGQASLPSTSPRRKTAQRWLPLPSAPIPCRCPLT